jgi:hypothetical protein
MQDLVALEIDRSTARHMQGWLGIGDSWERYLSAEARVERVRVLDEEFGRLGMDLTVKQIYDLRIPQEISDGSGGGSGIDEET